MVMRLGRTSDDILTLSTMKAFLKISLAWVLLPLNHFAALTLPLTAAGSALIFFINQTLAQHGKIFLALIGGCPARSGHDEHILYMGRSPTFLPVFSWLLYSVLCFPGGSCCQPKEHCPRCSCMGQEEQGLSYALGVALRVTSGLRFPRDLWWSGVLIHLRESSLYTP